MAKQNSNKRRVRCPNCDAALTASLDWDGKKVRCKKCSQSFRLSLDAAGQADSANGGTGGEDRSSRVQAEGAAEPGSAASVMPSQQSDARDSPGANSFAAAAGFGRFVIREVIRSGPDGNVHRAYDPRLEREVALKTIPQSHEDESRLARFLEEAKTVARLRHPNIVPVFESGVLDEQRYIVSQFVEGETLHARIQRKPVDQRQAAEWIATLAAALNYAHQLQVVHRDI